MASRSRMLFSSSTTRTFGSLISASSRGAGSRPTASGCDSASSAGDSIRSGEGEDEGRALPHAAPHLDRAAVLLHDPIDESEADSTALRLRREERLEYMPQVRLPGTPARVGVRGPEATAPPSEPLSF